MKNRFFLALFISLFIPVSLCWSNQLTRGVLNLSQEQLINQKSFRLEGEVEFYWNKLLEPDHFSDSTFDAEPHYVKIPKSWTSYTINDQKLPREGFATYRFRIRLNPLDSQKVYAIKMPSVFTSYKLWVNGSLLKNAGIVGTTNEEHVPQFGIDDIVFSINDNDKNPEYIEVVLQVSNFSHRRAGLPWPMHFGSYDVLKSSSRSLDILNLIVVGIILIIGLNHLNIYFFRRKDISNLYFGILSLVMILRNISTGDRILSFLVPNINWELLLKIDNFSGYGTIPFFALFFYNLYKDDFPRVIKNVLVGVGAVVAVLIFSTSAAVYGNFNLVFEIYLLVGGLYLTFGVLLIASIRKREGAILSFIGMFLLYATAINDVLSSMGLIQTPYVAPYGLVTFMLLQSFNITSKSAMAINENESLSQQLATEKDLLEKNIEKRTKEFQKQHDILIEHQEKEKIQAWINKGLAKINNVLSANKNDFSVLSRKVLTTLVKYMGVKMGALYVINDEEGEALLERVAQYGCSKEMLKRYSRIEPNDGLVGSTYTDGELNIIDDVPDNYYEINSGLGSSKPKSLLLAPLSTDDAVFGVIELARFDRYRPEELEFIRKISYSIASSLNNVRINDRNVNLIQQFQEQAEEIMEKEEKMRESLHELEYFREQCEKLKSEIKKLKK